MRVSWYRGAGASMAARAADRRADAVGVEERSGQVPSMKRLSISMPADLPDVQISRFRFFMEELRSRMLSLTPSLTRGQESERHPSFRSCQFSC
jgi:hypothetical protein